MTDEEVIRKFMQDDSIAVDATDPFFVSVAGFYAEIMKRIMAIEEYLETGTLGSIGNNKNISVDWKSELRKRST